MDEPPFRPPIRILHHMARSGGTVICKCLGSMSGIVLLSEIHPAGRLYNPLYQAHIWYNLLTRGDVQFLNQKGRVNFVDAIAMIHKRCRDQNKTLVIRDWSHLDFTAVPFLPKPSYRLITADFLRQRFSVIQTATVRHPIDQWLSLRRLILVQGKITLENFLHGHLRFAEYCAEIDFVRYEDFVRDPQTQLSALCRRLEIDFDPGFEERWENYGKITGDIGVSRGGGEIRLLPRREMEPGLLGQFEKNADYQRSLAILGYDHPV